MQVNQVLFQDRWLFYGSYTIDLYLFMMCLKYLILMILFLSSCSITHKNVLGTYTYIVPGWINAQMTINADSTFVYNYQSGLEVTEVKGKWVIDKNDYIILNSDKQQVTDSTKVEELFINAKDSIFFCIKDFEGTPLGGAGITFKGVPNIGISLNKEGQGGVSKDFNIEQFTIHYLGYTFTYSVENKQSDFFKVQVYYPLSTEAFYRFFTNEQWQLKSKILIDLNSDEKFKYRKELGK
jgi:hypothetical protein